jgi:hypothetical protein
VISAEEMMEKYRRGVVKPDDAVDYFYKRLYPRRYQMFKFVPRYRRLCGYGFNGSNLPWLIRHFLPFATGWLLMPLFALHYRKATERLAEKLQANRQPDVAG